MKYIVNLRINTEKKGGVAILTAFFSTVLNGKEITKEKVFQASKKRELDDTILSIFSSIKPSTKVNFSTSNHYIQEFVKKSVENIERNGQLKVEILNTESQEPAKKKPGIPPPPPPPPAKEDDICDLGFLIESVMLFMHFKEATENPSLTNPEHPSLLSLKKRGLIPQECEIEDVLYSIEESLPQLSA